jgi:hypothetical protein
LHRRVGDRRVERCTQRLQLVCRRTPLDHKWPADPRVGGQELEDAAVVGPFDQIAAVRNALVHAGQQRGRDAHEHVDDAARAPGSRQRCPAAAIRISLALLERKALVGAAGITAHDPHVEPEQVAHHKRLRQ